MPMRAPLALALGLWLLAPAGPWATEGGWPVCLANGRSYEPGDVTCIPSPDCGKRLARCDQIEDYVRWTILEDSCPLVRAPLDLIERLLGHPPAGSTAVPADFGG